MHSVLLAVFSLLFQAVEHTATSLKPPVIHSLYRKAPDFEYRDLDDRPHRLSELKGKVVLIDFWGTWCPGCVEEMPTLQRLYEQYRSDPTVAFVIVSQNDSANAVRAFVKRNHLTIPIFYMGAAAPPAPLAPSAWPATFFVSPAGILRGEHLGGADWSGESVRKYIDQLRQGDHRPPFKR